LVQATSGFDLPNAVGHAGENGTPWRQCVAVLLVSAR